MLINELLSYGYKHESIICDRDTHDYIKDYHVTLVFSLRNDSHYIIIMANHERMLIIMFTLFARVIILFHEHMHMLTVAWLDPARGSWFLATLIL